MSCVTKTIVFLRPSQDAQELVLQMRARDRIDRAERLVHQHHRRIGRECARDADPLLLAAGELARKAIAKDGGIHADEREQLVDARRDPASAQPRSLGTVATFSAIDQCGKRPIC